MRHINKILQYTLAVGFLSVFSCQSLVDDLDEDPNNPDSAPAELTLAGAMVADALVHEGELARLAGMWSGYFTGSDRQYIGLWRYNSTATDFDSPWGNLYYGVVQQTRIIQEETQETNNQVLRGISQVIEAHAVGTAASLWGDVPYRQAANNEEFPNPEYDDQLQVFGDMQVLLDEAITNLESGNGTVSADSDIFFDGDDGNVVPATWVRVAYTLKARYYLQVGDYAAAYMAAQNGIDTAEGSVIMPHGASYLGNMNVYFSFLVFDRAGYLTANNAFGPQLLLDRQNSKTDESARFSYHFTGSIPERYDLNTGAAYASEASFPLITYEENLLTLAEAGARSQSFAVGLGHLNEFRAYMEAGGYIGAEEDDVTMEEYLEADFQSGGLENDGDVTQDQALLREILEERYLTFIGRLMGFTDMRRTMNETEVRVNVPANVGSQLPERFIYPQSEVNANTSTPPPVGVFEPTDVNQ
ncbi:MAG: SusD/RagB family nutrient-binding outer membrane lipoprotein [Thermonemataceae bacterium]